MKRAFLIIALAVAVGSVGCSSAGSSQPTAPSSSIAATDTPDAMPKPGSLPTLEFVVASELPAGTKAKPGTKLKSGSYKPAMTGETVTSVQWVVGEAEGLNGLMLSLQFDAEGAQKFATLINNYSDKDLLFVLDNTIIGNLAVYESVAPGAVTFGSPEILAARTTIDSATVSPK